MFHEIKVKTVSSHSLSVLTLILTFVITIFFSSVFLLPFIKKLPSKAIDFSDVFLIIFFSIYLFHIVRNYIIVFRNSVIKFSVIKVKISPLFRRNLVIGMADIVSVEIKLYAGSECAVITYKYNEKACIAYSHQHPIDNVTNRLIGVQGLLESGSDWTHIYDLKKILEQKDQQS